MGSLLKVLGLWVLATNCTLSYYLPPIGHHPLSYWSPYYYHWPSPLSSPPLSYHSHGAFIDPLSAESIAEMKESFNSKRLEVAKALLYKTLETTNRNANQTNGTSADFRSAVWSLLKKSPVNFGNLRAPQVFPTRNDIQSHDKQLDGLGRFLYIGAGNVGIGNSAHYLFKTTYVFVSSTATLCVVSTCIPADQFVSGRSSVICRRKRESELENVDFDDYDEIQPSIVESLEPTDLPGSTNVQTAMLHHEGKASHSPQNFDAALRPSFTVMSDENGDDSANDSGNVSRKKRFLFLLTYTITTYSFATTTLTSTLSLYSSSFDYYSAFPGSFSGLLTCRPSNFAVC